MANTGSAQTFPYSYKTVSIPVNSQFTINNPTLEIVNPQNLYRVELLYTHIRILFDASIATQNQVLEQVLVNGLNSSTGVLVQSKGITLNKEAVSRRIDLKLDLTPYLYAEGRNQVQLILPAAAFPGTEINLLEVWKSDMAYTVKGIY